MNTSDNDQPHFPLKVILTEMGERTRALFEYYIQRSNSAVFAMADGVDNADVILVDYDHPGIAARLPDLKRHTHCVLMVMVVGDREIDDAVMVRKPLDSAGLEQAAADALILLTDKRQGHSSGQDDQSAHLQSDSDVFTTDGYSPALAEEAENTNGSITGDIPNQSDTSAKLDNLPGKAGQGSAFPFKTPAYFLTSDAAIRGPRDMPTEVKIERYQSKMNVLCGPPRTLEDLRDSHDSDHRFDSAHCLGKRVANVLFDPPKRVKAVQFTLADDADFYLLPTLKKVYTSVSLEYTQNVQRLFANREDKVVSVKSYTSDNVNELIDILNESRKYSFDAQAFCWLSALFSANGRLPLGFDLDTKCMLLHWPNLTRLELIPASLEIAAAWSDQPATLPEIVDKVRCEPRYVTSFLFAASSIYAMAFGRKNER